MRESERDVGKNLRCPVSEIRGFLAANPDISIIFLIRERETARDRNCAARQGFWLRPSTCFISSYRLRKKREKRASLTLCVICVGDEYPFREYNKKVDEHLENLLLSV
mmetsp:Transcript_1402/g.3556  ORF Transcript_1402/g.3556 Transcript_1402/m.3556 type:complete len:108 (+) Transcript_1402:1076-1399(+)